MSGAQGNDMSPQPDPHHAVAQALQILQEITGRRSTRWNGDVELEEVASHQGILRPDGRIGLLRLVWNQGGANRYRTVIHEVLHSLSEWTPSQYREMKGWEEGVVEQLQRLLRQEVLGRMDIEIPEADFAARDATHPFNPYIRELEELRSRLAVPAVPFYRDLLATPLALRSEHVRRLGENLPEDEQREFRIALALANARLRRAVHVF